MSRAFSVVLQDHWIDMAGTVEPKPRNSWKATVTITDNTIVKSYANNKLIARLLGRISLSREERVLRRLRGLAGVPEFYDRPSPYVLVMSKVPGVNLRAIATGEMSEEYLVRLKTLIAAIHTRGVAHGDAHHYNILIDGDDPYIVDFATAYIKPNRRWHNKRLFKWYRLLDSMRFYRVENRFFARGKPPKMFWLYELKKNYEKSRKKSNPARSADSSDRTGGA